VNDNDLSAFIRLGVDYQDSYYEYEIPLKVTRPGTVDPNAIWPEVNNIDLELALLTRAKLARDNAIASGQLISIDIPFTIIDGNNKITIKGQPDLSRLRAIMLGVRNPYKVAGGFDKSATVWFNELRLTAAAGLQPPDLTPAWPILVTLPWPAVKPPLVLVRLNNA
jgi:cell surface protein SprA